MMQQTAALLASLDSELGPGGVLTGETIGARYHSDWTRLNACPPAAVLRPRSTEEVATILRRCHGVSQPVVIQGGLTGLAGGATPRPGELSLSLERLSGIEAIDVDGGTVCVRAGTLLAAIHEAVAGHGLQFALDLPARGSCQIGGNIATNAGGNRVIRYGMTRALVLGLEAVLADGTVLSSMNSMLKNNAGYDLKQLFIGTEGTLGVVTRAVLRLHPAPRDRLTALVAIPSFTGLVAVLHEVSAALGGQLGSFEVMWSDYYEFAASKVLTGPRPFAARHPYYALVELEALEPAGDSERFETLLAQLIEDGFATDAVLARSLEDSARLWRVRESAGELMMHLMPVTAYDISLPIARMDDYLQAIGRATAPLLREFPLFIFGHLGDGNLHIVAAAKAAADVRALDALIYGALEGFGSVSAEHGIGVLKRGYLGMSRGPAEITLMRTLKATLDPRNILNPGRVL
ncbi:MAG TPA: FAD-binding oxidoreductase [Steroidobacteraceae bacterium]|nr:FAD-binding oxidoreductase [Steroidobacteraceae bacterium]